MIPICIEQLESLASCSCRKMGAQEEKQNVGYFTAVYSVTGHQLKNAYYRDTEKTLKKAERPP